MKKLEGKGEGLYERGEKRKASLFKCFDPKVLLTSICVTTHCQDENVLRPASVTFILATLGAVIRRLKLTPAAAA